MQREWIKLLERCCDEETGEVQENVLSQQLQLLRKHNVNAKHRSLSARASIDGGKQVMELMLISNSIVHRNQNAKNF